MQHFRKFKHFGKGTSCGDCVLKRFCEMRCQFPTQWRDEQNFHRRLVFSKDGLLGIPLGTLNGSGLEKPEFQLHRCVFLASVCILSQDSWVFRGRKCGLHSQMCLEYLSPNNTVFNSISLLSMPFKCTPWRQDTWCRRASGFRPQLSSDFHSC